MIPRPSAPPPPAARATPPAAVPTALWDPRYDVRLVRALLRPLVGTGLRPNHLTTLRLLTAVVAAALFAEGEALAAAWVFCLSQLLDHADGELARLQGTGSRLGHLYDLGADFLAFVCLFVGIGAGLTATGGGGMDLALGGLAGLAVAGIFPVRYLIEERQGKAATRQPGLAGCEAEDCLYTLPLVVFAGGLPGFLFAAALGAPLALALAAGQLRRGPPGRQGRPGQRQGQRQEQRQGQPQGQLEGTP